jgi:hypothetical protein
MWNKLLFKRGNKKKACSQKTLIIISLNGLKYGTHTSPSALLY